MTARKIVVLGEIGVGKSSLVRRLVHAKFDAEYTPTIGVDVYSYTIPPGITSAPMTLVIFDTDGNFGESIFRHIYIKQAGAALIVGDIVRRPTLDTMTKLGDGFVEHLPGRPYAFVTNKVDLLDAEALEDFPCGLKRPGVPLLATSAATGEKVQDAFHQIAATLARRGS